MIGTIHSLPPGVVQALGWTLLHFLWQGIAVGLLLYMALPFCRSALVRYNLALSALVALATAPVVTFLFLYPGSGMTRPDASASLPAFRSFPVLSSAAHALSASPIATAASFDWQTWFVAGWFIGVLVFGIRALGGWLVIERLRRRTTHAISGALRQRYRVLEQRLGLWRPIRYLESHAIDSPAVVGWFRPIVLLPVAAVTGLSAEELEALIAHELAHIKRLDGIVNLVQIVVEAVLFYHPATWWISRTVRAERENCCDDIAVAVCGDRATYARALTNLEAWRATPAVLLGANSASLKLRISRLLGLSSLSHSIPRVGASIVVLLTAGALLATAAYKVNFSVTTSDVVSPRRPRPASASSASLETLRATPAPVAVHVRVADAAPQAPVELASAASEQASNPPLPPEPPAAPEPPSNGSYIDGVRSAGLADISVDDLIALKGVGATPEYIREVRAAWPDITAHEIIALRAQGIEPADVAQYHQAGLKDLKVHQLMALKGVGVTPEYIRNMQAAGLSNLTADQYVSAKAVGITPEYVRSMRSAGYTNLSINQYVSAKAVGITPEFVEKARSHGLTNLTIDKLITLKAVGVF